MRVVNTLLWTMTQCFELSLNIWLNGDHGLHLSDPRLKYQYLFKFVAFHQNSGWFLCGKLLVLNALHMTNLQIDIAQMEYWKWLILCHFDHKCCYLPLALVCICFSEDFCSIQSAYNFLLCWKLVILFWFLCLGPLDPSKFSTHHCVSPPQPSNWPIL